MTTTSSAVNSPPGNRRGHLGSWKQPRILLFFFAQIQRLAGSPGAACPLEMSAVSRLPGESEAGHLHWETSCVLGAKQTLSQRDSHYWCVVHLIGEKNPLKLAG